MEPPDDLGSQIHYDIAHGRIEGPEILLTAEQLAEIRLSEHAKHIQDGRRFLGKMVQLTEGEPNVVYPPKVPNEPWTVGGWPPGGGVSII